MVNYTLKQLYSFETVVRLKSFSRAALELNITQPAVYMQIKQLRDNIGSDIIVVNGKKISPTFIGEKLLKTSLEIIQKANELKLEIAQITNPDAGHLNISVASTANSFVSRILADFKKSNPNMTFNLEVTNRVELLQKIKNKKCDFLIMGEPPQDDGIFSEVFMQNPLIAICHPEHKFLQQKNIKIADLVNETLITREYGSGTRDTIERITGLKFNSEIQINSNEAIIEAVRAGLGIGFVSNWTVDLELKAKVIDKLDVVGFPIIRNWYIVSTNDNLSIMAKKFKKFMLTHSHT